MAKPKLFDWYNFLSDNILHSEPFESKKIAMTFWTKKQLTQAENFTFHCLIANSYDCNVSIDITPKVQSKTLISTRRSTEKLVMQRRWNIQLAPGQIAYVTIPAYVTYDSPSQIIYFPKAKVVRQSKGKRIFKRSARSLGKRLSPGWLALGVISFKQAAQFNIKVKKDKSLNSDASQNMTAAPIEIHNIWNLSQPDTIDLTKLAPVICSLPNSGTTSDLINLCVRAYSNWATKCSPGSTIKIRLGDQTTEHTIELPPDNIPDLPTDDAMSILSVR